MHHSYCAIQLGLGCFGLLDNIADLVQVIVIVGKAQAKASWCIEWLDTLTPGVAILHIWCSWPHIEARQPNAAALFQAITALRNCCHRFPGDFAA